MSINNIDRIKRESKAERARKEQVRRQATQDARSWRRLTPREQERRFGSDEDAGIPKEARPVHRIKKLKRVSRT